MNLSDEFPLAPELLYLNHAAVSPWPRRTAEAVHAFADENLRFGSLHYPRWLTVEARLRERLARLVGAPSPDDIALVKNTSEALSFVAYGLSWQAGDRVVITDQEFPSNRIVWESLRERGVEVRQAALGAAADPEAAVMAAVDGHTRLVAVSSVQYASGLRMDLERLGAWCRARGVLLCVDAIQSLGAVRFDAQAYGADFVMADGHKWMLGPEGLGLFYCRAELRERLRLTQFGWHMVERPGDYDAPTWAVAASARRFECGSPNMLGIHALERSLSLLEEVGMARVEALVLEGSGQLIEGLHRLGLEVLTPAAPERRAGIVTFRQRGGDPAALHRALTEATVVCAVRGGGVRFSPHFYTGAARLERALALLERCL